MVGRTLRIHGAPKGEVMAMLGSPGNFYRGRWQDIEVIKVTKDEDIPLEVRKSLVGLVVPTIFSKERLERETGASFEEVPQGARLAYIPDVEKVLRGAGKEKEATELRKAAPGKLDLYVFEKEAYKKV